MDALPAHLAERHRRAGRVLGGHLVITVRFPYRRWFLLIILNLSTTITVRAGLTIIYPTTTVHNVGKPSLPAPFMLNRASVQQTINPLSGSFKALS